MSRTQRIVYIALGLCIALVLGLVAGLMFIYYQLQTMPLPYHTAYDLTELHTVPQPPYAPPETTPQLYTTGDSPADSIQSVAGINVLQNTINGRSL